MEPDSGRSSKMISFVNPRWKEHQGRTLVLKGRSSKQWETVALKTSYSKRGRGMGTEQRAEIEPAPRRMVGDNCIMAADGAKAWQGAAKKIQVPVASGVHPKTFLPQPLCEAFSKQTVPCNIVKTYERKETSGDFCSLRFCSAPERLRSGWAWPLWSSC